MGDCCRRVVVATVLLAACTCVLATSRVIECSVEAANLAKSGRVFQERALSPEVIADGVPPLFTVTSVAISAFDRSFPDNTLRGVDVSAETADGFPASSENACGVGSGMLCPRGFPCERDDQCAIGSICSSNRICSEFDPVPTAAFFDVGLALLGVRPIQYAQYHLEGVIREAVVTTIGRGMSMSDVGVISVTATPSSHCPALFVTVRVSVANPVIWSSIWLPHPAFFAQISQPFRTTGDSSFIRYLASVVSRRLPGFQVAEVAASELVGVFGTALHLRASVEPFMQAEGSKLTDTLPSPSGTRGLQVMVCCDCPVDDTGEVLKLTRIETGTAVDKTDTDVTLGVSAGLFVGILSLIGLYKVWWKQYRARQHAQSLRWRRSRSAAGDVEMETFHTTRHMPSAASHILGTMSSPLPSPHATAAASGVNFRRTTVAPPSTPTMGGTTASGSAAKAPIHTVNPLVRAEAASKVEEKRAAKWERVVDEEGDVYYYNPTTGQSSWTEPTDDA